MSAIAPSQQTIPASQSGWIPSRLYRMSVDEYEALVESGGLKSRNHVPSHQRIPGSQDDPESATSGGRRTLRGRADPGYSSPIDIMSRPPSRSGSLGGIANPNPIGASCEGRSAITRITIRVPTKSP